MSTYVERRPTYDAVHFLGDVEAVDAWAQAYGWSATADGDGFAITISDSEGNPLPLAAGGPDDWAFTDAGMAGVPYVLSNDDFTSRFEALPQQEGTRP